MKTLDDIIPPSRRPSLPDVPPPAPAPRQRRRFPMGTTLVVLLIIGVSVGALFYFASAEIAVTPMTRAASVTNATFTAGAEEGELPFEVITVEKVATQSVASSGTKAVSATAQGTITVYNTQNVTQRLITNTRFQTASGLIYRIRTAVTVPPAKSGTPGSATATVFADKPGSEYNIGPTSFTLPGLSGSPLYTQVTAKSVAPMAGGASGNEPTVATDVETSTRTALSNSLATDLETELRNQVPEGYILLSGAVETSFAPLPTVPGASAGMADLKEQGTARGVIFSSSVLAKAIAEDNFKDEYKGEPLTIGGGNALVLNAGALPSQKGDSFAFSLSGTATLISTIDASRIAAAVAGKERAEAENILKQYPEIKEAIITLRPFWRTSFPADPVSIKVVAAGGVEN